MQVTGSNMNWLVKARQCSGQIAELINDAYAIIFKV